MSLTGQNLTCVRGDTTVFSALDFDVGPGHAVVVRGANGSGKSSLLRLAAGFLIPAVGELRCDGTLVSDEPGRHLTSLHYVGHLNALKPAFTVAENLAFWSRLFGSETNSSTSNADARALDRLGLTPLSEMPTNYLSAGQRRRLALARLIAAPRPLWLLDEPTASLDDAGSETLIEVIAEHRSGGGMVMVAVHGDFAVPDATTVQLGGPATELGS